MKETSSITEFIELLSLGIWSGGMVEGLEYVSAPTPSKGEQETSGLTGLWLAGGVMIERARYTENGRVEIIFSLYDPYRGVFDLLSVTSTVADCDIINIVRELLHKAALSARRGRKSFTDSPFKQHTGYEANHSSMYGGAVAKPKTRK